MIGLTRYDRGEYAHGERCTMTWPELGDWLAAPVVTSAKDAAGGYSLAHFAGDHRRRVNVQFVYAIGLDFDKCATTPKQLAGVFSRYRSYVYSTHSHTNEAPRSRVILLPSRPMTADEHTAIMGVLLDRLAAARFVLDRGASCDAARFWYSPARAEGAPFEFYSNEGTPIDVDGLLSQARRLAAAATARASGRAARRPGNVIPFRSVTGVAAELAEARWRVARMPAAIAGQRGHDATWHVARLLVADYGLSDSDALSILREYSRRCSPPWSERELAHKIASARSRARISNPIRGTR